MRCWTLRARSAARRAWSGRRPRSFPSLTSNRTSAGRCASTTACRGGFSIRAAGRPARNFGEYLRHRTAAVGVARCHAAECHRLLRSAVRAAPASGVSCGAQYRPAGGIGGARFGDLSRDTDRGRPSLPAADRARRAQSGVDRAGDECYLKQRNASVRLEHELRALRFSGDRVSELDFGIGSRPARRGRCGRSLPFPPMRRRCCCRA